MKAAGKKKKEGCLPWLSSGWDPGLPLQGARVHSSIPGPGIKIPRAARCGQKKKKESSRCSLAISTPISASVLLLLVGAPLLPRDLTEQRGHVSRRPAPLHPRGSPLHCLGRAAAYRALALLALNKSSRALSMPVPFFEAVSPPDPVLTG